MAPLAIRLKHARHVARGSRIRASAIERDLGTRYTIDTLRKLIRRYPRHQFLWLMGGDNLMQFGQWKNWRGIARLMPIAVIERPGYNIQAHGSPVMSWLRRFVRPAGQSNHWTDWRPPALVLLRFRPDPRSATLLRQANPLWHREYEGTTVRDMVTRRLISGEISLSAAQAKERH